MKEVTEIRGNELTGNEFFVFLYTESKGIGHRKDPCPTPVSMFM